MKESTKQTIAGKAFLPVRIMGLTLRNRFIRSATLENMAAPDRLPGPEIRRLYEELAAGGVGLISTSAAIPDPSWAMMKGQLMLGRETDPAPWKALVRAVHDRGALISLQMSPPQVIGGILVGPSEYLPGVHALTLPEIEGIVAAYGRTAALAREIGMDAVQVHGGHGYGLSRFLSPASNRREDAYGGSVENRVRVFVEIRRAVAASAGEDFPVWIKMSALEGIPGGLTPELAAPYAPLLAAAGYGAIEVTGGAAGGSHDSRGPLNKKEWFEGFYLEGAARVKAATELPVAAVGGIRTLGMIAQILDSGTGDLISLSRPLIREPGLINRWAAGDPARATCVSCNGCTRAMVKGKGLYCVLEKGEPE